MEIPVQPTMQDFESMRSGPFVPGRNANLAALAVKKAHLRDSHVAPLNELADAVADSEGLARGLVPYVDPQLGGVGARVLALLDNPSTKAEAGTGSGLLSLENNDPSAKNCATFYNDLALTPDLFVHWNVAPSPVSGEKNAGSSAIERERGAKWLTELIALLPDLKVILLMGENARDGWKRADITLHGVVIPSDVPHPSQRGLNNSEGRVRLRRALLETKNVLDGKTSPPSHSPAPELPSRSAVPTHKWAWWPTFEHYCAPGSTPWGVSSEFNTIERTVDGHNGRPNKWCVIGRSTPAGWTLDSRRKDGYTKQLASYQIEKYDAARAGGSRGNLGKFPPANEIRVATRNLDA